MARKNRKVGGSPAYSRKKRLDEIAVALGALQKRKVRVIRLPPGVKRKSQ